MVELVIAVIDCNLSLARFHELNSGSSKAEAVLLGRDLEAASVALHDIVIADAALVMKAADAIKVFRSGTPSLFRIARCAPSPARVSQPNPRDFSARK
jgi:hypothetical protein